VIFWQDIVDLAGGQRAYTPKSVTTTQQSATTTYICTSAEVLNIRKSPNTSSEVLGAIKPKQTIEVYSISNGWAKVKYQGKTAYASAKYLERIE
jgi:N-acetylmuramoyl-L-alanine amidase